MAVTVMEHPLAKLVAERLMSPAKVQAALGIPRHRWYRLLRGDVELSAKEVLAAAELFGVEPKELLP